MRSRVTFFILLFVAGSLALPLAAHAGGIPFFGPIVPSEVNRCAAGWGAVITVINNIIRFLLTLVIVFIAPLMLAYSGFLFVVNPVNSGGIAKAKSILLNTIIGIVIALAGWMIVDAIMAVLYHPTDPSLAGKAWSQLITSGGQDFCLKQEGALQNFNEADLSGANVTGVSASGGQYLSLPTNADCSPGTIQQATKAGGYNLTPAQINTLSCLAVPESSCGKNTTGAKQSNGTPTTASGMFQVVLGLNDKCHNLNLPVCTQAAVNAQFSVSGNLNCSTAFRGGSPKPGMESLAAACRAASADLNCNASAAACLVQANGGGFTDWTGTGDGYTHATQQNCVTQYANK